MDEDPTATPVRIRLGEHGGSLLRGALGLGQGGLDRGRPAP
jgi:hypothetical protein